MQNHLTKQEQRHLRYNFFIATLLVLLCAFVVFLGPDSASAQMFPSDAVSQDFSINGDSAIEFLSASDRTLLGYTIFMSYPTTATSAISTVNRFDLFCNNGVSTTTVSRLVSTNFAFVPLQYYCSGSIWGKLSYIDAPSQVSRVNLITVPRNIATTYDTLGVSAINGMSYGEIVISTFLLIFLVMFFFAFLIDSIFGTKVSNHPETRYTKFQK